MIKNKNWIFGALYLLAPCMTSAATFDAVAAARIHTAYASAGEYLTGSADTASGTPFEAIEANATVAEGVAFARVFGDPSQLSFSLSSAARAPGSDIDAAVYARARSGIHSGFSAVGSGIFHVNLAVSAAFSVTTDRDDGVPLAHVIAGFEITTRNEVFTRRVSNTDPGSPLAGLFAGAYTGEISGSVAVADGDLITLRLFGVADTGEYPLFGSERDANPSFFSATSRLNGGATVGAEGFDLVPVPLIPAPVPLPAGFPLMLAGIASFAVALLRRRFP